MAGTSEPPPVSWSVRFGSVSEACRKRDVTFPSIRSGGCHRRSCATANLPSQMIWNARSNASSHTTTGAAPSVGPENSFRRIERVGHTAGDAGGGDA